MKKVPKVKTKLIGIKIPQNPGSGMWVALAAFLVARIVRKLKNITPRIKNKSIIFIKIIVI